MEQEPIDSFNHYPEGKGNQSITLFLISFIYMFLVFLVLLFLNSEGVHTRDLFLLAFALSIVSFGISLGGLTVGLSERKYSKNWVKTGIVGNIVLILLPIGLLMSIIY